MKNRIDDSEFKKAIWEEIPSERVRSFPVIIETSFADELNGEELSSEE